MNISISNKHLTASVNQQGAELTSLKDHSNEYIWEGNPEFWGKHSPILFPIVGTLKNNTFRYNEKDYSMSRHGFARENKFEVSYQDGESVIFSFVSNEETLKVYPFNFELQLKYTLKGKSLFLDYSVKNTGNTTMPFSLGAHPAFALPGNFEDYSLQFEKDEALVSAQLDNDLLSNKTTLLGSDNGKLFLNYSIFENDALIFKELESKSVAILRNGKAYLKVSFKDFPHLGIWTKLNAPFLCIEPWQGYSDTLDASGNLFDKEGIILLNSDKEFSAGFSIEILR